MRQPRIKLDEQAAWYHCYNRVAGTAKDLPFGAVEKAGAEAETSGFTTDVGRRVRYWTDGLVIGSRLFLYEVMANARSSKNVARHRVAVSVNKADGDLCAWRRVRESTAG